MSITGFHTHVHICIHISYTPALEYIHMHIPHIYKHKLMRACICLNAHMYIHTNNKINFLMLAEDANMEKEFG